MADALAEPGVRREELAADYHQARGCVRCELAATRTQVVFGAGNADAELMFVGEAPGAEEDRRGLPFVGRAGQLLNELLGEIGLERGDVFIANVLKCRPPGNRDPQPAEIEACHPWLERQLELIAPRVVATLGNFSTKLLSGTQTGISRVHGTPQVHVLGGRPTTLLPLYHPAAALRTPKLREVLAADMRRIGELLAQPRPDAGEGPEDVTLAAETPEAPRGRPPRDESPPGGPSSPPAEEQPDRTAPAGSGMPPDERDADDPDQLDLF